MAKIRQWHALMAAWRNNGKRRENSMAKTIKAKTVLKMKQQ